MLRSTLVIRSYFTTKLGLSLYFQYFSLSHFKSLLPVSSKFLMNIKTKNCKTLIYSKCIYTYFYGPMNIWDVYSDLHNFEKKMEIYHTWVSFQITICRFHDIDRILQSHLIWSFGHVSESSFDSKNFRLNKKVGYVHLNAFAYMS